MAGMYEPSTGGMLMRMGRSDNFGKRPTTGPKRPIGPGGIPGGPGGPGGPVMPPMPPGPGGSCSDPGGGGSTGGYCVEGKVGMLPKAPNTSGAPPISKSLTILPCVADVYPA